jgi:hypothetical protein
MYITFVMFDKLTTTADYTQTVTKPMGVHHVAGPHHTDNNCRAKFNVIDR